MAVTGKTGADAIFKALHHICTVLNKYETKLIAVVAAAQSAGAITSDQASKINAFITVASATCDAFSALADYSGF
jgi:acetyl-CoA carboxylase carboxyltransferase component